MSIDFIYFIGYVALVILLGFVVFDLKKILLKVTPEEGDDNDSLTSKFEVLSSELKTDRNNQSTQCQIGSIKNQDMTLQLHTQKNNTVNSDVYEYMRSNIETCMIL